MPSRMEDEHGQPLSRLQEIRRDRGLSAAELARKAGVSPATVSKIELGHRGLTRHMAPLLAAALGCPPGELYAPVGAPITGDGHGTDAHASARFRPMGAAFAPDAPPPPPGLPRDLPVHGSAEGGPDGAFAPPNSSLVVDWATRPPGLLGLRQAFALICEGHSMEPRFFPGELLYVHPTRPPVPGDYVVAVLQDPAWDEDRGYIKRLVRRGAEHVVLRQHNPDREIVLDRARVKQLFLVLRNSDLYGM